MVRAPRLQHDPLCTPLDLGSCESFVVTPGFHAFLVLPLRCSACSRRIHRRSYNSTTPVGFVSAHPWRRHQVSLQRLERFLLEAETKRLDAMSMSMAGDHGGRIDDEGDDLSRRVVLEDAAFGPVTGL